MAASPNIKELLERNKQYAKTHQPMPYFPEMAALGWTRPKTLVFSCADMRSSPEQFLALSKFDVIVMRNICGHVEHELASILALDTVANFDEVMVIHHTDCGGNLFTEDGFRQALKERVENRDAEIDALTYGGSIKGLDLAQTVRDDVSILKESPLMRKSLVDHIHGFVLDIKTGLLTAV